MRILVISGTNRSEAVSLRLASMVADYHRVLGAEVDLLDLGEMGPAFLQGSAYQAPDPSVTALVDRFLAADGVVFIVPEYNGSFPGVLKLYIDMLPYPAGLDQRPCAFIGLAAGQFRGLRAVEQLQQVACYRNALMYPRRIFIGGSYTAFTEAGTLADAELATRLSEQAAGFQHFITALRA